MFFATMTIDSGYNSPCVGFSPASSSFQLPEYIGTPKRKIEQRRLKKTADACTQTDKEFDPICMEFGRRLREMCDEFDAEFYCERSLPPRPVRGISSIFLDLFCF